jgi:hypothetical protein
MFREDKIQSSFAKAAEDDKDKRQKLKDTRQMLRIPGPPGEMGWFTRRFEV